MINIVYPSMEGPPQQVLPGMWLSKLEQPCGINIGMNLPGYDGMLVVEPRVVAPHLYEPKLAEAHRWVWAYGERLPAGFRQIPPTLPPLWPEPTPVERPWEERLDAVVFMSRLKSSDVPGELYSLRSPILQHLAKRKPVACLRDVPFGQTKIEALSRYRYCFCPENCWEDGYVTEKLVDAIAAGCVPLYLGAGHPSAYWENPLSSRWEDDANCLDLIATNKVLFPSLLADMRTENLWKVIQSTITGER